MRYILVVFLVGLLSAGCSSYDKPAAGELAGKGASTPAASPSALPPAQDGSSVGGMSSGSGATAGGDDNIRVEVVQDPSALATPKTTVVSEPGVAREFQNGPTKEELAKYEAIGRRRSGSGGNADNSGANADKSGSSSPRASGRIYLDESGQFTK